MPLMKFDMLKGRTPEQIGALLDIVYEVQLDTLGTPVGDRYQVVNQHEPYEIHILDTGLGVERSDQVVVITVITRPPKRRPFTAGWSIASTTNWGCARKT